MVDVGHKAPTRRFAKATAYVRLPPAAAQAARESELQHKGSPAHVAVLAGIMAAKRTSELIPLCHLVSLDNVDVAVAWGSLGSPKRDGDEAFEVMQITCSAWATHATGVEMEALVGASIAALTVYDMLKASSHGIVIERVQLVEKRGGKKDFVASHR